MGPISAGDGDAQPGRDTERAVLRGPPALV